MNHIDQHSLELYALGSEELELSVRQIERHLAECAGCRDLLREIQEFYGRAEKAITQPAEPPPAAAEALARKRERLPVSAEPGRTGTLRWQPSLLGRLYFSLRSHPAMAGTGALMLGALAWAIVSMMPRLMTDRNPAYASLNPGSSKLEAYNSSNELLWSIPVTGIEAARDTEASDRLPSVVVTDLDGDGRNEVVVTLKSIGNVMAPDGAALAAVSPEGKILWQETSGRPVRFRGEAYPPAWLQCGIIVSDFDGDGKKEILCRASTGRSPWVILRYDAYGKCIGEYWHHGHLLKMQPVDFSRSGKTRILLGGANDSEGAGDFGFAVIMLLNPRSILGKTEAVTTRGYGLPPSEAEIACVRFPNTAPNIQYRSKPSVDGFVIDTTANAVTFSAWWTAILPGNKIVLEYFFGPDMTLRGLKSTDSTIRLLKELQQKGEMSAEQIEDFLPSLKSAVKYWEGKGWGSAPHLLVAQNP